MAIAIRIAMIRTTTINSIRVKPFSSLFKRSWIALNMCHLLWFVVFPLAGDIGTARFSLEKAKRTNLRFPGCFSEKAENGLPGLDAEVTRRFGSAGELDRRPRTARRRRDRRRLR